VLYKIIYHKEENYTFTAKQTFFTLKSFLIVLSIFALGACNTARDTNQLTKSEVDRLVENWLALWSSYDLEQLDDIFWNDSSMTYFSSEKRGLIRGYDKMRVHHEGFGFVSGGKQPAKSLWLEDLDVTLQPSFAVVGGIWYFGDRSMPKDSVQNGPVSFVILRDKEGKAKIAHTHFANYK